MAIVVAASGTQTATINTEHTLYTTTSSGHYCASVDLTNMASGDTTEIRVFKKVLTGSTALLVDIFTFVDAQTNVIFYLPHLSCPFGYKISLKQTAGTGRNFEWSVENP